MGYVYASAPKGDFVSSQQVYSFITSRESEKITSVYGDFLSSQPVDNLVHIFPR